MYVLKVSFSKPLECFSAPIDTHLFENKENSKKKKIKEIVCMQKHIVQFVTLIYDMTQCDVM